MSLAGRKPRSFDSRAASVLGHGAHPAAVQYDLFAYTCGRPAAIAAFSAVNSAILV